MTVYIIGAGLFGSVARDLLLANGQKAFTIDCQKTDSASKAAGCLIKPSWLSCLGSSYKDGMNTLDELYGLKQVPMQVFGKLKLDSIYHAPPDNILKGADIYGNVTEIDQDAGHLTLQDGRSYSGKILVAAGVWSKALLGDRFGPVKMEGQRGVSFLYRTHFPEAKLRMWAPYKQSVAFEINNGITWFGDGTSIIEDNWKIEYENRALDHALALDPSLSIDNYITRRSGLRPYVTGHSGYFKKVGNKCWVSTGGAKNGVVLAALQAKQFLENL